MNKIVSFITGIVLWGNIFAQAPSWAWAKSAGGAGEDHGVHVRSDANNNVYVVGNFASASMTIGSTILTNVSNNSLFDIFIAKYDSMGNLLWAQSAGGTNLDVIENIVVDKYGNAIIGGGFSSQMMVFGHDTLFNGGGNNPSNFFLVKYDPSGNVIWAKGDSNGDNIGIDGLCIDASGNIITTGYFSSATATFDTTVLRDPSIYNEIFITKYDSSGNILWARSAGGASFNDVAGVATDRSGNIFICGIFGSPAATFGNITLYNPTGLTDVFLAKYDPLGNIQWALKSNSASGWGEAPMVATDRNGNVAITGAFGGGSYINFGGDTLTSKGLGDVYVAKFDANGNLLWDKSAGSVGDDEAFDITFDAEGYMYIVGEFDGPTLQFGTTSLTSGGSFDAFVAKYDPCGNLVWAINPTGGTLYDFGNGIALDASENILITGYYYSSILHFGASSIGTSGGYDVFVAKLNNPASTLVGQPTVTASGPTSFCAGDSVILTSSVASSYQWSNGDTTRSVIIKTPGNYSVAVSSGAACSLNSSPVTVTTSATFNAGILNAVPDTVCSGIPVTVTLSANVGSMVQWQTSTDAHNFAVLTGSDTSTYLSPPLTQTTYYRTVAGSGSCADTSAVVQVLVKPSPAPPDLSVSDSVICPSDSAWICAPDTFATYIWNTYDTGPCIAANLGGGYWVSVTNAAGCTAVSGHRNISVYPVSSVSISVQGDTLSSFNSSNYQWIYKDTLISGANASVYVAHRSGNYAVQVTDSNGCITRSNSTPVIIAGISPLSLGEGQAVRIYPDPFTSTIYIRTSDLNLDLEEITIYDLLGRNAEQKEFNKISVGLYTLEESNLPSGAYFIKVKVTGTAYVQKIIKL